jgi:hypothetical protein
MCRFRSAEITKRSFTSTSAECQTYRSRLYHAELPGKLRPVKSLLRIRDVCILGEALYVKSRPELLR